MSEALQDLTLVFKTVGFKAGTAEVDALRASILGLNTATGKATAASKAQGVVLYDAHGNIVKTQKAMDDVAKNQDNVTKATDKASKGFLGLGETLDKTIKKVAMWTISTGAVYGTFRAFKSAISIITEHDQAMINLRKVYSGAESDLAELKVGIMSTARAMQSLHDAAFDAAITVARTGRTGIDVIRLTETALIAQNIAELDSAQAVEYLNAALIQFNQTTDQAIRILDEWNELSNRTPAVTEDLARAVSVAGSVFEQAGASIEFLNAATAALVEITAQSGNIIGRAERTMAIYSQRISTVNKLTRIGIDVYDKITGQYRGIDSILLDIANKWDGLSDAQKANIAQTMAGARQQQYFLALMENMDIVLRNQLIQWGSLGSAIRENEIFLQSINKRVDGLINALERLAINLGDAGATAAIKGIISALTAMVNVLNDASAATLALSTAIGALVFVVAPIGGTFRLILTSLGSFIGALAVSNKYLETAARSARLLEEQMEGLDDSITQMTAKRQIMKDMVETLERLFETDQEELLKDTLGEIAEMDVFGDLIKGAENYEDVIFRLRKEIERLRDESILARLESLQAEKQVIEMRGAAKQYGRIVTKGPLSLPVPQGGILGIEGTATEGIPIETQEQYFKLLRRVAALGEGYKVELYYEIQPSSPEDEKRLAEINDILEHREKLFAEVEIKVPEKVITEDEIRRAESVLDQFSKILSTGIASAIASGFEGEEVRRAMNNMVTRMGTLMGDVLSDSILSTMSGEGWNLKTVINQALAGLATAGLAGLAGGAASGLFGWLANQLFPTDRTEAQRQINAIEDNTIQLRVLNENIQDLTSFFVNAPAGFAIPAGAPAYGGGALAAAGGGVSSSISHIDQRSITLNRGAINVVSQPGESGVDIARAIETQLANRWGMGAQVVQTY